jgi:hypothetical protein
MFFPSDKELNSRIRRMEQAIAKLPQPKRVRLSVGIPRMKSDGYWWRYWSGTETGQEPFESLPGYSKWFKTVETAIAADGVDSVLGYFLQNPQ